MTSPASVGYLTCCARGCSTILTGSPPNCRMFPEEPNRILEHLHLIGREDLISLPLEQLRQQYFICFLHYEIVPDPVSSPHGNANYPVYQNQYQQSFQNFGYPVMPYNNPYQNMCTNAYAFPNQGMHVPVQRGMAVNGFPPGNVENGWPFPSGSNCFPQGAQMNFNPCMEGPMQNELTGNEHRPGTLYRQNATDDGYSPKPSAGRQKKCKKCAMTFCNQQAYRNHMMTYHKDLLCEGCNKFLVSSYYLREHQKKTCKGRFNES